MLARSVRCPEPSVPAICLRRKLGLLLRLSSPQCAQCWESPVAVAIELRSAVRDWFESVGAWVSHEGSGFKCSRSDAPERCEKRKETRRAKSSITKEKQRETKAHVAVANLQLHIHPHARACRPMLQKAQWVSHTVSDGVAFQMASRM
jgi:hypothetical protein